MMDGKEKPTFGKQGRQDNEASGGGEGWMDEGSERVGRKEKRDLTERLFIFDWIPFDHGPWTMDHAQHLVRDQWSTLRSRSFLSVGWATNQIKVNYAKQ